MADISDVENALVTLIGSIIYPNGTGQSSVIGSRVDIYRGWPNAEALDAALRKGRTHVTVFEQAGYSRLTGGYLCDSPTNVPGVTTITATVSGSTVTIGGTPGLGQLVGVIVDGAVYSYALTALDTLVTAATALAAVVNAGPQIETPGNPYTWTLNGDTGGQLDDNTGSGLTDNSGNPLFSSNAATVSGATITFATNRPIAANTGAQGTSQTNIRWQVQGVKITAWAPTPAIRDAVIKAIDTPLAALRWLPLYDQNARIEWRNTYSDDCVQNQLLWKRDLFYTAQFATSSIVPAGQVLFGIPVINGQSFINPN